MRVEAQKKRELAAEEDDGGAAGPGPSKLTIGSTSQLGGSAFGGAAKGKKDAKGGDDPTKYVPQEFHTPAYLEALTSVFNAR